MEGVLVVLVPVFIAGFALLMDRFENKILTAPTVVEQDSEDSR